MTCGLLSEDLALSPAHHVWFGESAAPWQKKASLKEQPGLTPPPRLLRGTVGGGLPLAEALADNPSVVSHLCGYCKDFSEATVALLLQSLAHPQSISTCLHKQFMSTLLLFLGGFEFFCLPGGPREHPGAQEDNGDSHSSCEATGYPTSAMLLSSQEFEMEVGWEQSGRSQT